MKTKGIVGLEVLLSGAMATLAIMVAVILPTAYVKLKLDAETFFEYKYNKVQHLLLTILSTTQDEDLATHEGKKVSEVIAERYRFDNPSDLGYLESQLDKLIEKGKCYQLSVSDKILIDKKCEPKYWSNSTFVLPYNPAGPLVEEIKVGIG